MKFHENVSTFKKTILETMQGNEKLPDPDDPRLWGDIIRDKKDGLK